MKITLSDCVQRINQILNYPALNYADISHFFDQAISELNTSLRIALPLVSELVDKHTKDVRQLDNTLIMSEAPNMTNTIPTCNFDPPPAKEWAEGNAPDYLMDSRDRSFWIRKGNKYLNYSVIYAMIPSTGEAYQTISVNSAEAYWVLCESTIVEEPVLTEYMTNDWIILFLIPYVCFKFAVRNGDSGALYNDEFIQGFQQLQSSYDVPNKVYLVNVAGIPAYENDVKKYLPNLNTCVITKAITDDMRVPTAINGTYGSVFDRGGWGI